MVEVTVEDEGPIKHGFKGLEDGIRGGNWDMLRMTG